MNNNFDMKKFILASFSLIILYSCTQEKPHQSDLDSEDGWISLLDDELSMWDEKGSLSAELVDGTLSLTGSENHSASIFTTNENYYNFHLKMDVQSSDTQSSVLFRLNDKLKITPERAGYSISIDANLDELNPTGTIFSIARSTVPQDFNATKWNSLEITAIGTRLTVFINGQKVAEANDKRFQSGKIGLQVPSVAGETVRFRNIRIQSMAVIAVITELLEDRYRADTTQSFESIFDGKTLAGWSHLGDGSWDVEDGAIHGYSGVEGGFLVHENVYKNFYLVSKFKIIKEDNSGIWVRKSPDSANVSITDAIECNIYDHNGPSHAYSTGSIATHARAWYGMIDYEGWNEMEIFAEEEHIVMYVNGQKSSESYLPSTFNKAGNICLQGGIKVFAEDKGPSDVYFKEIMVKSMD